MQVMQMLSSVCNICQFQKALSLSNNYVTTWIFHDYAEFQRANTCKALAELGVCYKSAWN